MQIVNIKFTNSLFSEQKITSEQVITLYLTNTCKYSIEIPFSINTKKKFVAESSDKTAVASVVRREARIDLDPSIYLPFIQFLKSFEGKE